MEENNLIVSLFFVAFCSFSNHFMLRSKLPILQTWLRVQVKPSVLCFYCFFFLNLMPLWFVSQQWTSFLYRWLLTLRFRCVIHFRPRRGGYSVKTCLIYDFSESRTNKEISNTVVFEPLVVAGLDFELWKRSKPTKQPLLTTVNDELIDHTRAQLLPHLFN